MTEQGLQNLLKEMSLEEKVNQMSQVIGGMFTGEVIATGPMAEKGFTEENLSLLGSVLSSYGAEKLKAMQKAYMEKQPHHIPMLFMFDVINGFKTIFPIPLGQGASFEPELSERCAEVSAKETAVSGVHVTFSPMVDLVRDARWGRVMESTGEDPYLNSLFSEAMVKGYQGNDLKEPFRVAACVKHFAGYGAPVAGRDYNTVELSKHTLKEFYLPAYKAGVDAGAALMMTSFNTIEGVPATGNKWLMKKILREEMGFDGVLISDWGAVEELIYHGYCADRKDAARRAVEAGVDIDMMAGIYSEHLCKMVRNGEIDETLIDESVMRILELKNKLGLFENPYKDADETLEKEVILCQAHRDLAREAARKSFVLLKNEGVLPLSAKKKTAYIGPYVESRELTGSWSFLADMETVTTLKEAVLERAEKDTADTILFSNGCSMLDSNTNLSGFKEGEKSSSVVSEQEKERMMAEALETAKSAEVVVMALGEHRLQSGEATSNANIQIPKIQMELFEKVCQVNDNVVVVLFSGRPLDIRELSKKAKAILQVWLPGTEGARAIVDVLSGEYAPSGKLPMSFPYSVGQVPISYNEYSTGRPYLEDVKENRFRSMYLDIPNKPLYPFGYGLTYTQFSVSPIELDKNTMTKDEQIQVSVNVKNVGDRVGTETIQMYIRDVTASVVRPVKELKGFVKVTLAPEEEQKVSFTITEKELQFITENDRWESEAGIFHVFVGMDSNTKNMTEFRLV